MKILIKIFINVKKMSGLVEKAQIIARTKILKLIFVYGRNAIIVKNQNDLIELLYRVLYGIKS